MRAHVQRVSRARVSVDGRAVGEIGPGAVILLGVKKGDRDEDARRLADRCADLRCFADEAGNLNRSLTDVGGSALVVSQFTLYGDTSRGRRPSWVQAARPEQAEPLIEALVEELRGLGATVATGRFRAHMEVELVNDGPVTVQLDV